MKWQLITLAILSSTAHAANDKQPPKDQLNCEGEYTMYTHPDKRCREKLAEEYQALLKKMLEQSQKAKVN